MYLESNDPIFLSKRQFHLLKLFSERWVSNELVMNLEVALEVQLVLLYRLFWQVFFSKTTPSFGERTGTGFGFGGETGFGFGGETGFGFGGETLITFFRDEDEELNILFRRFLKCIGLEEDLLFFVEAFFKDFEDDEDKDVYTDDELD